jgi:LysR family hydrogen peroxide-inducible transcriptional activator
MLSISIAMPSLQQLRYLVAVADTLHFRRAAELSHVTQPTLSAQLKALEDRLGVTLVERNRSRVLLTPLGADLAERARRILRDVEDFREAARTGRAPMAGTLRTGVVQSLGSYLFPLIAPDMHATYPELRLYVREGLSDALLRQLETGTLEVLFHPLPIDRGDIEAVPIFEEPLLAVIPREHSLATQERIARHQLKGETLLALEPGHRLYEQMRALAEEFQAEISHDYEGTSLDTLRQMVAMGMGLSLLPALYVRSEVSRETLVTALPIEGHPPSRTVGMAWRRGTAHAEEFRELARLTARVLARDVPEVRVVLPEDY